MLSTPKYSGITGNIKESKLQERAIVKVWNMLKDVQSILVFSYLIIVGMLFALFCQLSV